MKIFRKMPSGFLQGSVNYHMNDVLLHQRKRRNVTSETRINLSQSTCNLLRKCLKNVQCLFTTNLMFCCIYKNPLFVIFFSYKDKLSHSQNSEVTSLLCQLLDSLRHVFIKLRKDYNIRKLSSLKH